MCDIIQKDLEIMGGTPVFKGTRVPISTLFDYLSDVESEQDPIYEFLDNFPSVSPEQVSILLEYYRNKATEQKKAA